MPFLHVFMLATTSLRCTTLLYPAPPHDADGIAMHTPISPTPGANNSCYR